MHRLGVAVKSLELPLLLPYGWFTLWSLGHMNAFPLKKIVLANWEHVVTSDIRRVHCRTAYIDENGAPSFDLYDERLYSQPRLTVSTLKSTNNGSKTDQT